MNSSEVENLICEETQSLYRRKIWFLYEWLMQKRLNFPDLKEGNYVHLLDEKHQYASPISINSARHRIRNNLPGNVDYCPLINSNTSN